MYYYYELCEFPSITQLYWVTRNTVWEIADKDNILIFIKEGNCTITYENIQYPLNPGDVFFIPANHSYLRQPIDNSMCTMAYIHFALSTPIEQIDRVSLTQKVSDFRASLDDQILNGSKFLSSKNIICLQNKFTFEITGKLFSQMDNLTITSAKRQLMYNFQSSITLCNILSILSQDTIDTITSNSEFHTTKVPDNLKKAIQYIHLHYTKKITLGDLAEHCSVTKQQLIRYFKSAFNLTPITYITEYKINCAKDLLFNQPQLTISEISDELGFENQQYFSRVFCKVTGETPSFYRYRTTKYDEYIANKKEPPYQTEFSVGHDISLDSSSIETSRPSSADL